GGGSTTAETAGRGVQVQPCGPGSAALQLGAGTHVLRTSHGSATGIDLDQVGLGSERGGAALATGPSGQVVPATVTAAPPVPSVRVLSQDRTNARVSVDVAQSKSPCRLVPGQGLQHGRPA